MKKLLTIAIIIVAANLFAQKKAPQNWQLLDPRGDKVFGTSSEKAYESLKGRKSTTVIVAVIDAGIDINHEDLKDVIWVNPKEIPGNGIDDDNNGYIDDVNGWSFIGGKNGDIKDEASELSRLYFKLNNKFKNTDTSNLSDSDAKEFAEFKKIRKDYKRELSVNEQQLEAIKILSVFIEKVKKQNSGEFSKKALKSYVPENEREEKFQKRLKLIFALGLKPGELDEQISKGKEMLENRIRMSKINADSIRKVIVGDDVNNPYEKNYGSSNVIGPEAMHGTHVAGIIAAVRNNGKGMDGIAGNVKIMVLRAVPNGDERDKDIANAIRYAADNGAKIINMSFGKYYSPDKKVIDEAVQYAFSKDVLLVHGAGNESKDEDVDQSYPNRYFLS
ncbi:MAG: S8 family serine peptidase, partial [Bacteroidales bacterium]|nr:S8 family serine peptidase [Bacteroidales bacterium]